MIKYEKDTQDIVTLKLDMRDRKSNVINHDIGKAFFPVIELLKKEKAKGKLKGVILTSAKKTFLVGGDLDYLYHSSATAEEIFQYAEATQRFFRDLERSGVPVVAAINGTVLASGLELALVCHHRIVIDRPDIKIGFPEVTLGLMPGCGGIIRTLWKLGIEKAYEVLTSGKLYTPKEAKIKGLVEELATHEDDMIAKAKQWILANPEVNQPWDVKGEKIPNTAVNDTRLPQIIAQLTAIHFKKYRGNYPAPQAILNTLSEALKVNFDTACEIESRNFTHLVTNKNSKNMTKVFWFDLNEIRQNVSRPKGFGKFRPRKVGIIGSGKMGSGIAYSCAMNGIEVILKDVSKSIAERGKQWAEERLEEQCQKGQILQEEKVNILNRIQTTEDAKDFKDCDLVLEAVFENQQIKGKVAREAGKYMDEYSFFGTNTSMLPIDELSQAYPYPENYIGLHFFAPVSDKKLVEVVKGNNTSDETIARAFDFVKRIRKTPIIVKDNPGFYASRVQNVFLLEGIEMLKEGYPPAIIENTSLMAGMPEGPLAMSDTLSLNFVLRAERRAAEIYGEKYIIHPAVEALQKMKEKERTGRFVGAGFYDYEDQERQSFWEGLAELFPTTKTNFDIGHIKERIYFAQVLEAVWCYQESIVGTVAEANIGSVYGWGFPAFKGGVLQFVNDYGIQRFIEKAKEFEDLYGPRFIVPKILRKMGEEGGEF